MKWYPGHHMTESIVHIFHIECLGWSHYSFFLASPALDGSHNCLISSSVGLTKVVSFASLSASSTSLFFDFSPAVGCFLSWLGWEVAEDGEDAERQEEIRRMTRGRRMLERMGWQSGETKRHKHNLLDLLRKTKNGHETGPQGSDLSFDA